MSARGPLAPFFWQSPLRYLRWSARERPAYFWSVAVGAAGPVILAVVPPVRRYLGDEDAPPIPMTYPGVFFSLSFMPFTISRLVGLSLAVLDWAGWDWE